MKISVTLNSLKLVTSPFLVLFQTFFKRRTVKGKLDTQMALQDTPRELGFLGTQGLLALGQSRHSGTRRALRYSGTLGT